MLTAVRHGRTATRQTRQAIRVAKCRERFVSARQKNARQRVLSKALRDKNNLRKDQTQRYLHIRPGSKPRAVQRRCNSLTVFRRPGGSSGGPEPDPIPNSAVKPPSANGTSSQDAGE